MRDGQSSARLRTGELLRTHEKSPRDREMASSAAAVLSVRCRMKVPAYIPARLSGIHGPACSGRVDVGHSKVLKTVDIMLSALYIYC